MKVITSNICLRLVFKYFALHFRSQTYYDRWGHCQDSKIRLFHLVGNLLTCSFPEYPHRALRKDNDGYNQDQSEIQVRWKLVMAKRWGSTKIGFRATTAEHFLWWSSRGRIAGGSGPGCRPGDRVTELNGEGVTRRTGRRMDGKRSKLAPEKTEMIIFLMGHRRVTGVSFRHGG